MTRVHNSKVTKTKHLIVGSGMAGLSLALKLGRTEQVVLVSKGSLNDNNSWLAQGGIAAALDEADSMEEHFKDTVTVADGICDERIVKMVVENGPRMITELIELGVDFTKAESKPTKKYPYHLTQEGGHSRRRVIHAKDHTGQEVIAKLIAAVRKSQNITVHEDLMAIDLLTTDKYAPNFCTNQCLGAYFFDRKARDIKKIRSEKTYLCTGGHGKIYLYTSNPNSATGDGIAMGHRAGCKIASLEFMQFHPTCLYHQKARNFLVSEAVRGEGGVLKDLNGDEFMQTYHPRGSLAPRDVVARAIDHELKRSGFSNVLLDVRHLGKESIVALFPRIYETCLKYGIDMVSEMIPVVPAAHYSCGGIMVDEWGQTGVRGLYAIGEVACTGLHGANRLASNSLLEALVFADQAAKHALTHSEEPHDQIHVPPWQVGTAAQPEEMVLLSHSWDEIRRLMWNYVGIVRSESRLKRALDRATAIKQELDTYYWDYELTEELIEVRNLVQVALLTIRCAMARKESRGVHFNSDFPEKNDEFWKKATIIW